LVKYFNPGFSIRARNENHINCALSEQKNKHHRVELISLHGAHGAPYLRLIALPDEFKPEIFKHNRTGSTMENPG